jgi:hypothetical protein
MDFSLNLKAFLKQLPRAQMSGHQKFVAVAALTAAGSTTCDVRVSDVQKNWRKSQLGVSYNPSYYDRAQSAGWVNPTGAKGKFRVTQGGIDNLVALAPEFTANDLTKAGSLAIFGRKATHSFDKFLRTTLAAAKNQVLIADSWVDGTIFDTVLDVIPNDCTVKLIYAQARDKFDARSRRFSRQFSKYACKKYKHLHDRFMIVDDAAYILGPSIKDAASYSPALLVTLGSKEKGTLQNFFNELWAKAK